MSTKDTGWWTEFFDFFRPVFGIIDAKTTNAQARYLIKKLDLTPGNKFLDCPCGIGRITIPMAKKGIRVTGVDITKSYLNELNAKARRAKLNINTIHSDMRKINFDSKFDAAGNLWTSFGFFEKESDDLLTLKKMYKALKPGGRFVLHVINRDWIIANFQSRDWQEIKGLRIFEDRKFDFRNSVNYGNWHFMKNGQEKIFSVHIRMYSFHELVRMFEAAGFADIEGYGNINDEPISLHSRMMFVFGTKPKH